MEHLPIYIPSVFIITTALAFILVYKASGFSKPLAILLLAWLSLQAIIGLTGFYKTSTGVPPGLLYCLSRH